MSTQHQELSSASTRTRVVVLMGGPDAERDVSIMSGTEIARALQAHGAFDVTLLLIDRPSAAELRALLAPARPQVIFPIVHGPWGEGGPLQEMLESLFLEAGVPYVGPRPKPARTAMDKIATKSVASSVGVRTPASRQLRRGEPLDLAAPLVLKPSNDGSSVDLRICRTQEEAVRARTELEGKREFLMAEQYIRGREMTVGIVHGTCLPIIEIVPKAEFYDYQAKYISDETRYVVAPELAPEIAEEMRSATRRVYEALGLRDVARADFMVDERGAWFLEINTAPGMTTHSLVPMASRHTGVDMPELCANLVQSALARGARRGGNTGANLAVDVGGSVWTASTIPTQDQIS